MAENRNLALQLLITAKDEASSIFDKVFGALNDGTNVIATAVRNGFSNLFGGAIDSAAAFETQLGKVVAKGDESYADTAKLKTGLQDLAAQFGITGTEAAQGMEVLAAAGLNAGDAMKALPAVLNLAKIEGISLDDAATKLSDSLSIMGLGFGEAGRMADVLAKGANISTASAASLAEALSVAGGQAKSAGMDLEATVAALDLLHSAGIKGSAAGTSLAAILTQLQNPASKASQELDKLGITSRDLGDVLDGLKAQGANSNAAILAFGETAGPGLRAMIEKGSAGLKDYDAQLRNAGGAASESAKKLSMDFDSAVKALSAAWESIKVAFAEPVLKPLADGAREAADALNTALKDGALKPVQEAIKTFAENGVSAIRDFVKSFDFESAIAALQGFANNSKQWFGEIKDAGTTTADAVTVAWNALSAGFKTIGAGLLEIVAKTTQALAEAENAASKIGLGSAERAAELRATARGLEADAAQLMQSVAQDGQELTAAFNRLTGVTDDATAAQERLKAALPAEELQTINYTLKDYQAFAAAANAEAERAKIAYDAGALSAQEYGAKLLAAADANKTLNDATTAKAEADRLATEKADAAAK
ncbi:MAG TPA: phage tail tape measure protein, partial [Accumulibacter sp.]|nr:phage tail tape measure protein [Accumulibacter sp.]